jgi:hypothetical protein
MDQLARDDITAAAAAHRELGRDYDGAVAEGLIERIGAEIDRRIDARLALTGQGAAPYGGQAAPFGGQAAPFTAPQAGPVAKPAAGRPSVASIILALGSMGIGIGAAGTVLSLSGGNAGMAWLVALIWIVIGIVNVSYSRRH